MKDLTIPLDIDNLKVISQTLDSKGNIVLQSKVYAQKQPATSAEKTRQNDMATVANGV